LKGLQTLVQQWLVPIFRPCSIGQLLLISILAGVGEELLFRGALQAGIQQYGGSAAAALVIASVLFGAAHPISATYAFLAGAVGAYLGWLWLSTGNLLVPMVAHAAYDFAALVYLLQREPPSPADAGGRESA
jgi:membrane protease YdiL (CAAX protease family)